MNRQKLATVVWIILSIVFSLSLGLFVYFKVFSPKVSDVYEKYLYYPEDLYQEYQKEAEGMITRHEYTCQYPSKTTIYSEDGQTTVEIIIGEYNEGFEYSNYITATVKNFGTNKQEVTFERSKKSAEEAYKIAKNYRNNMYIFALLFALILVIFTVCLIISAIKRHYKLLLTSMISFALFMAFLFILIKL